MACVLSLGILCLRLGFVKRKASLAFSQHLTFTIHHPYIGITSLTLRMHHHIGNIFVITSPGSENNSDYHLYKNL